MTFVISNMAITVADSKNPEKKYFLSAKRITANNPIMKIIIIKPYNIFYDVKNVFVSGC